MAISKNIDDREHDKFEENSGDGGTDVRVNVKNISTTPIFVSDVLNGGGEQDTITIGVAASLGAIGGTNRPDRKYLLFQAKDKGIYYGFDNTVTTSTGIEIFKNQLIMIPVGENTDVYFIATGAGKDLRIQEVS
jgi:hypothetical protein